MLAFSSSAKRAAPRIFPVRLFSTTTSLAEKVKLDFFSKEDCGLCVNAKTILDKIIQDKDSSLKNEIEYKVYDITKPENKEWWDSYCFDVPVLHITHEKSTKPVKFMHRLDQKKVIDEINRTI
ncbi:Mgp12 protein [Saccharomycopsis crataegensis]|uniref:Glutaredoxin-like protein n=1 Tax=Saccharomycopsis crataegensis TaxID=43959 RepID=A0AAV5QSD6_9ASCO|nr:Mgp12 protein [Saccharomycopsis crataegensis]